MRTSIARGARWRAARPRRLLLACCGWLALGCGGGLQVETVAAGAEAPGNVAVFVSVLDSGEPVTGLTAAAFSLVEDGQALSESEAPKLLLDRRAVAAPRALLLVDVSAATPEDVRRELRAASELFADTVRRSQPVSVYVFDGSPSIRLLAEFDRETRPAPSKAPLAPRPRDTSRDLNGAVTEALKQLDARLKQSGARVPLGTLVVFSGGPDLAGRVSASAVAEHVAASRHAVFTIGFGERPDGLRDIGKSGYFDAHGKDTISLAFEEAAHRVEAEFGQYYLLSYCSPARANRRLLRLDVRTTDANGERLGSTSYDFDAQGFRADCKPERIPRLTPR